MCEKTVRLPGAWHKDIHYLFFIFFISIWKSVAVMIVEKRMITIPPGKFFSSDAEMFISHKFCSFFMLCQIEGIHIGNNNGWHCQSKKYLLPKLVSSTMSSLCSRHPGGTGCRKISTELCVRSYNPC